MDLFKMLSVAFCYILHCEYEFPSDPLANQRGSREFNGNQVDGEWSHPTTYPTAYTKAGVLEGYFMKTIKGRVISAFDGIPYGEDTGGHNRFMASFFQNYSNHFRNAKNEVVLNSSRRCPKPNGAEYDTRKTLVVNVCSCICIIFCN